MNKKNITGFSLIEVMIAILLFSIVLIGFVNYQRVLLNKHHNLSNTLQANHFAFQFLDSYPQNVDNILPKYWLYNIENKLFNSHCKMVFVSITPPKQTKIQQQRLFCD